MAHNINFNELTGQHSFFSVKEKPWHGLGRIVEGYPTSRQALQLAGLDFEVKKLPNIHRLADGTETVSENSFFTYRVDNGAILGDKVGTDYKIVQNVNAFEFFDSIVGGDGIMYETAGALGKGERIFITAKLPGYISVGDKDEIEKYIFLTTAHDGSSSISAAFTPVRIVCQNTLSMALNNCSNVVKIRHTENAEQNLKEAHKIMGISNKLSQQLDGIFNQWAKVRITDKQVLQLMQQAMSPSKEVLDNIRKGATDSLSTVFKNICDNAFMYAMTSPTQQTETTKGTLFGAYNAVTGYFQNVKEYREPEDKLNSVLFGTALQRSQTAFRLCDTFRKHGDDAFFMN
jgi:phage/plasmid-like protein (TIGR03299 family)